MISFAILTSAPADLGTFLIARGFAQQDANGSLVGALPGVEWVRIPNLIVTALGNPAAVPPVPPTYDVRIMFMVKISDAALADQVAGLAQTDAQGAPLLIWQRTKLGAWILANSTAVSATDASGKIYRGRKVTGQPVWLLREDDASQIGVWQ